MKFLAAALASLFVIVSSSAHSEEPKGESGGKSVLSLNEVRTVAPALEKYTQDTLLGDLWKRPGLSPRDRSGVTLALASPALGLIAGAAGLGAVFLASTLSVLCAAAIAMRLLRPSIAKAGGIHGLAS